MARLIGSWNGKNYQIQLSGSQILGIESSKSDPDLPIPSNIISRTHGEFFTDEKFTWYRDLGSSNGTSLNGRMLEKEEAVCLKNGDVLSVHAKGDASNASDVTFRYIR